MSTSSVTSCTFSADQQLTSATIDGVEYKCDAVIGRGSFSTVYRAHIASSSNSAKAAITREVALRLTRSNPARLRRELEVLRLLQQSHNVVHLFAGGFIQQQQSPQQPNHQQHQQQQTQAVMAMELLRPDTLYDFLAQHGRELTLLDRFQLCRDVCRCVADVHAAGCLHRDVKLQNFVFCTATAAATQPTSTAYSVKLIDFGLAMREAEQLEKDEIAVGTVTYMPPEAASNVLCDREQRKQLARPSDVWSVGVVLFSIFTLSSPYGSTKMSSPEEQTRILRRIARGGWRWPKQFQHQPEVDAAAVKNNNNNTNTAAKGKQSNTSATVFDFVGVDDNNDDDNNNADAAASGVAHSSLVLPEAARELIASTLEVNPSRRPTMEQLCQRLDAIIAELEQQQQNPGSSSATTSALHSDAIYKFLKLPFPRQHANVQLPKQLATKICREETAARTKQIAAEQTAAEELFWLAEVQRGYAKHPHRFVRRSLVFKDATGGFYCDRCTERFDPPRSASEQGSEYMHCSCGMDLCTRCADEHTARRTCADCSRKFALLEQLAEHKCAGTRRERRDLEEIQQNSNNNMLTRNSNNRKSSTQDDMKQHPVPQDDKQQEQQQHHNQGPQQLRLDSSVSAAATPSTAWVQRARYVTSRSDVPDCFCYVMQPNRLGAIFASAAHDFHSCVLSLTESCLFIIREPTTTGATAAASTSTSNHQQQQQQQQQNNNRIAFTVSRRSLQSANEDATLRHVVHVMTLLAVEDNNRSKQKRGSPLVSLAPPPPATTAMSSSPGSVINKENAAGESLPLEFVRSATHDAVSGCTVLELSGGRRQTLGGTPPVQWELRQHNSNSEAAAAATVLVPPYGEEKPLRDASREILLQARRLRFVP